MGSTGNKKGGGGGLGLVNLPLGEGDNYTDFKDGSGAPKWFNNEKLSNFKEWFPNITEEQRDAIDSYTGIGYHINSDLYNTPWDDMSESDKAMAKAIYDALSGFELKHPIGLTRQTDFQIFGASKGSSMTLDEVKNFLTSQNGIVQADGFLSAGADDHGVAIAGSGLVLHFKIPESKGAVGYIEPLGVPGENEVLINNNSVWQADLNSVKQEGNKVHVTMYWLGQATMQTIDPKNKSWNGKKKKG